jgi:SAM-dependent MidA family methyltransferase
VDPIGGPRLGLRRHELPDPSEAGEDVALVERIRASIATHGPMPFARFMELALYDPDGGYYRGATARPGRAGDFVTAPELHPIFGQTLARAVLETWERLDRPDLFVIHEHGAGEGALAQPLLAELATSPLRDALRYRPIEIDDRRVTMLTERLATAGLARFLAPEPATPFEGLVLANEVLDALPVHRVRQRDGRLVELAVDLAPTGAPTAILAADDGRASEDAPAFVEVTIEPTTAALAERMAEEGIELAEGQTAEICLALDAWMLAAAAPLRRGLLVAIDYGASAAELYDPVRRRDGTLLAYVRQHVHGDPYRHVGRQDLTAHVDVTAVDGAAGRAGLKTVGITTQAEALMGLGIEQRLQAIQADPATTMEAYLEVRAALMRLLDPAAMGRFRVMVFGRGWLPPAPGDPPFGLLDFRLPARPGRQP